MIRIKQRGSFKNTQKFLKGALKLNYKDILDRYGKDGVAALAAATPIDSGETALSWEYEIHGSRDNFSITWTNSHINDGVVIAIILQYGHGTGTGGYVQATDYINPAMRKIFDDISAAAWKEVTQL